MISDRITIRFRFGTEKGTLIYVLRNLKGIDQRYVLSEFGTKQLRRRHTVSIKCGGGWYYCVIKRNRDINVVFNGACQ